MTTERPTVEVDSRGPGWLCRGSASVVALALGCLVGAAGCGLGQLADAPAADRCKWMNSPAGDAGGTVILVDVSNSTRGVATGNAATGGPAPDYTPALDDAIGAAVDRRDAVSIASFSGTTADLGWAVTDRSTNWTKGVENEPNQKTRRNDGVTCLTKEAAKVTTASPVAADSDIVQAITIAAGRLKRSAGTKHLVVLTDGLATTGCADLRGESLWTDAQITGFVERCGRKKSLRPGDLTGIDVSILGVGHSGPGYPIPDGLRRDWLKRFWTALCQQGGSARHCEVDTQPMSGETKATSAAPDASVDDSVVPLAGKVIVYPFLGAALFDGDSDVLRPAGKDSLAAMAKTIKAADWVQVNGYAAPHGNPAFLLKLSQGRADRVGAFLASNEVPVVAARGLGVTRTCPDLRLSRQVSQDECSRRVDIVVGSS